MPILPSPSDMQRQTPRSRMSMPNISAGADEAARINLGQSISNAGQILGEITDHRASVQAEDAMNQLAMRDIELTAKLQTIKNGDAANQDLLGNFTKEREAAISEIKSSMKNTTAIGKFDAAIAKTSARFGANVLQHQITEAENYSNIVHQSSIETGVAMAAQNYSNEIAVNEAADSLRKKSEVRADKLGISDPIARTATIQNDVGGVYLAAIDSALDDGNSAVAKRYLELNRPNMTQKQIDIAEKRIRPALIDDKAAVGVNDVWSRLGPKSENDPVQVFAMEESLRKIFNDDAETQKAAIVELRSRASGFNAQQSEVKASNVSAVMDMFNGGMPLAQIKRSVQFQALPGDEQTQIIEHIADRGYTLSQRAKADKASLEHNEHWATYWELTKPGVLTGMTESQVMAYAPSIGWPLTNKLMEVKRGGELGATIDSDLFNRTMMDAGFDPYSKDKDERAKLGRMRDQIESIIATEQKKQGGKLSRDSIEKIAQREIDRKVVEEHWYGNKEVVAGLVKPEQRANVIVPFDQIPPDQAMGLINVMRSRGVIDNKTSDKVAMVRYKQSLQKAYGRYQAGATQQEIFDALDGKE